MNNDQKEQYIIKAIRSCKTIVQLESCRDWINSVRFKNESSIFEATIYKQELLKEVNQSIEHMKKLNANAWEEQERVQKDEQAWQRKQADKLEEQRIKAWHEEKWAREAKNEKAARSYKRTTKANKRR